MMSRLKAILYASAQCIGLVFLVFTLSLTQPALAADLSTCSGASKAQHISSQEGYALKINALRVSSTDEKYVSLNPDETILYADLSIEVLKDGVSVNPLYASLRDGDGFTYTPNLFSTAVNSISSENDLTPGELMRGWVSFKVPKQIADQGSLLFQWKPFSGDRVKLNLLNEVCD